MIEISLFENVMDSFNHGIKHLLNAKKTNSIVDYKQGLLSISQCVELLLKQLLCLKNPIYMFDKNSIFDKCENPMNPKLDELYNCKSLDINKLCREVKKHYPNDFIDYTEKNNKKNRIDSVDVLAKERNKIQHFAAKFNENVLFEKLYEISIYVILPAIQIISRELDTYKEIQGQEINDKLIELFDINLVPDQQELILKLQDNYFFRATCHVCGEYSSFIVFDDKGSFPEEYFCVNCGTKHHILCENFYECPECNIGSLYFIKEIETGICLNYGCDYGRDGDEVDMIWCDKCKSYSIEGICNCDCEDE